MEIVYNNTEAKKRYKELNIIRKVCRPQTILITDKGGNTVSTTLQIKRCSKADLYQEGQS